MLINRKAFALIATAALLSMPLVSQSASAGSIAINGKTTIARDMGGMTPEKMEQRLQKMTQELNLTPTQVDQLRTLRTNTRTQMDGVLSADQKAKIKAAMQAKKGYKVAMQEANVTEAQRTRMKQIRKDSKAAMEKILTPEQLTKLKAKMKEHRGDRRPA
jgi:Spy/CpxP family protein refolding chaperone